MAFSPSSTVRKEFLQSSTNYLTYPSTLHTKRAENDIVLKLFHYFIQTLSLSFLAMSYSTTAPAARAPLGGRVGSAASELIDL